MGFFVDFTMQLFFEVRKRETANTCKHVCKRSSRYICILHPLRQRRCIIPINPPVLIRHTHIHTQRYIECQIPHGGRRIDRVRFGFPITTDKIRSTKRWRRFEIRVWNALVGVCIGMELGEVSG